MSFFKISRVFVKKKCIVLISLSNNSCSRTFCNYNILCYKHERTFCKSVCMSVFEVSRKNQYVMVQYIKKKGVRKMNFLRKCLQSMLSTVSKLVDCATRSYLILRSDNVCIKCKHVKLQVYTVYISSVQLMLGAHTSVCKKRATVQSNFIFHCA